MDDKNINLKKIPYPEKRKIIIIFIFTVVIIFLSSVAFTKMHTKIFQSSSFITLEWKSNLLNTIFIKEKPIDLLKIINDTIFSDTILLNSLISSGIINEKQTDDYKKEQIEKIKGHFNIEKCCDLKYCIEASSGEPEKYNKILNEISQNVIKILHKKILDNIDKEKQEINLMLKDIQKIHNNIEENKLIQNEFQRKINYSVLLFEINPPSFIMTPSKIPDKHFYPNEKESAIAGFIIALSISIIATICIIIKKVIEINNLTIFEAKKDYVKRKS